MRALAKNPVGEIAHKRELGEEFAYKLRNLTVAPNENAQSTPLE